MRKPVLHISVFITLAIVLALTTIPVESKAVMASSSVDIDQALCLPVGEDIFGENCLLAGPAARLDELAAQGFTVPAPSLYASLTPYELGFVPFSYAKVDNEEIPLYATLEDAEKGVSSGSLPTSRIKYVSLIDKAETNKGVFYQIANEKWIYADYVQKVGIPNFQGYVFKKNPEVPFGWIINETTTRKEPGYQYPEDGIQYWRFDRVNIYDSLMINDVEWVMVGPGQWIEHRNVARVVPNYEKPEGVQSERWIEINLYEQVLTIYEEGRLLFATLVSTGVDPFFTQPGVFQVYKKLEFDPMRGTFEADRSDYYYLEEVPYILYYDQARALHGAYWHGLLGYQQSHGCVNLSVADAHWIYNWALDGEYVYVWDPSGETPTDPSFYGSGGF